MCFLVFRRVIFHLSTDLPTRNALLSVFATAFSWHPCSRVVTATVAVTAGTGRDRGYDEAVVFCYVFLVSRHADGGVGNWSLRRLDLRLRYGVTNFGVISLTETLRLCRRPNAAGEGRAGPTPRNPRQILVSSANSYTPAGASPLHPIRWTRACVALLCQSSATVERCEPAGGERGGYGVSRTHTLLVPVAPCSACPRPRMAAAAVSNAATPTAAASPEHGALSPLHERDHERDHVMHTRPRSL